MGSVPPFSQSFVSILAPVHTHFFLHTAPPPASIIPTLPPTPLLLLVSSHSSHHYARSLRRTSSIFNYPPTQSSICILTLVQPFLPHTSCLSIVRVMVNAAVAPNPPFVFSHPYNYHFCSIRQFMY